MSSVSWEAAASSAISDVNVTADDLEDLANRAAVDGDLPASGALRTEADVRRFLEAVRATGSESASPPVVPLLNLALTRNEIPSVPGLKEVLRRIGSSEGLDPEQYCAWSVIQHRVHRLARSSDLPAVDRALLVAEALDPAFRGMVQLEQALAAYQLAEDMPLTADLAKAAADSFAASPLPPGQPWEIDVLGERLNALWFFSAACARIGPDGVRALLADVENAPTSTPYQVRRKLELLGAISERFADIHGLPELERLIGLVEAILSSGDVASNSRAQAFRIRARFLRFMGRSTEALDAARSAVSLSDGSVPFSLPNSLVSVGYALKDLGRDDEAALVARQAAVLFQAMNGIRGLRAALSILAQVVDNEAERAEAIELTFATYRLVRPSSIILAARARLENRSLEERGLDWAAACARAEEVAGRDSFLYAKLTTEQAEFSRLNGLGDPNDLGPRLQAALIAFSQTGSPGWSARAHLELSRRGKDSEERADHAAAAAADLDLSRRVLVREADRIRHLSVRRADYLDALAMLLDAGRGEEAALLVEHLKADGLATAATTGLEGIAGALLDAFNQIAQTHQAVEHVNDGGPEAGSVRFVAALDGELNRALAAAESDLNTGLLTAATPVHWKVEDLTVNLRRINPRTAWVLYEIIEDRPDAWIVACCSLIPGEKWAAERVIVNGLALATARSLATSPGASARVWTDGMRGLGRALIPERVIRYCQAAPDAVSVAIAPSGQLWAMPWAALRVADDRCLIELCELTLFLSARHLVAMHDRPRLDDPSAVTAIIDRDGLGHGVQKEIDALTELDIELALNPDTWLANLADGDGFTAASMHGVPGQGLAQGFVWWSTGQAITAAHLAVRRFPRTVVAGVCGAASCHPAPGREPLGLPAVALSNGATWFVGGLYEIDNEATGEILSRLYGELHTGRAAPAALRTAMLAYLSSDLPNEALGAWAGLVVIGIPS